MKLNLGGGTNWNPPGYIAVDRQDGQEAYPLAYADDSVDEIRASHLLEHFSHRQVRAVVKEWVRCLKPGGVLKIAVPDFAVIAQWYAEGRKEKPLQLYLMGGQRDENDYHKTVFVEEFLRKVLTDAGLTNIVRWESEMEDNASWEVSLNLQGMKPITNDWIESIERWNKYSQYGEDSILKAIFDKIGVEHRYCVDVGAADGLLFSNVRQFIEQGWGGVLIEADEDRFKGLVANCESFLGQNEPPIKCFNHEVKATGSNRLDALLDKAKAPLEFDLLNIDIDGQDYFIWNSLLKYNPRVVVCEYDPEADPMFIPQLGGSGQAGWQSLMFVAAARGYLTLKRTETNLICVRCDICEKFFVITKMKEATNGAGQPNSWNDNRNGNRGSGGKSLSAPAPSVVDDWGTNPNPVYGRRPGSDQRADRIEQVPAADGYSPKENLDSAPGAGCRESEILPGQAVRCARCGKQQSAPAEFCGECGGQRTFEAIFSPPPEPERDLNITCVASVPRLGINANWHCTIQACLQLGLKMRMVEGVFWGSCLSRGIQDAIDDGADVIVTIDYDSVFDVRHLTKLLQLLADQDEFDCIVPVQMKRECNQVLFQSNGDHDFNKPLTNVSTGHFGLTVFDARAFAKLPKPWMQGIPNENGDWADGKIDDDIFFWSQWKRAGLKIGLANEVIIGHIEFMVSWPVKGLTGIRRQSVSDYRKFGQPEDCGGGLSMELMK